MKSILSRSLAAIAAIATLGGCAAPSIQTSGGNKAKPVSVYLDDAIKVNPDMYYLGPGSGVGLAFGAIGGAVVAQSNETPGKEFQQFAAKNGIRIEDIAREESINEFKNAGRFVFVDKPGPTTLTLKINIPMYGFTIPTGLSSNLVPVVKVDCSLVDAQGSIVWTAHDIVTAWGSAVPGHSLSEYADNPSLIKSAWKADLDKALATVASEYQESN